MITKFALIVLVAAIGITAAGLIITSAQNAAAQGINVSAGRVTVNLSPNTGIRVSVTPQAGSG